MAHAQDHTKSLNMEEEQMLDSEKQYFDWVEGKYFA